MNREDCCVDKRLILRPSQCRPAVPGSEREGDAHHCQFKKQNKNWEWQLLASLMGLRAPITGVRV